MSTYEISKSSLLSLKAEILRKQQELSKTKAENDVKIRNLKKVAPLEIKNKGLEHRLKNDLTEEEENLLKKSKSSLEAKARLYDKLSKQKTFNLTDEEIEYNRRYLVRFDRKSKVPDLPPEDSEGDVDKYPESDEEGGISNSYDPPQNPDEEWVEYVDCLGRTRTCLSKDLDHIKSKDKDLKLIVEEKRRNRGESSGMRSPEPPPKEKTPEVELDNLTEDNELLSSDMRRELLRRQWEKEEEELRNKSDIHYQDILFNEARTHGVGYYGFSKDEEERAKQQEDLKKLRQETKREQKRAQDMKEKREKQLAARVKAARNRKRARMGLPPEEDEPEPPPKEPTPPKEVDKKDEEKEKALEKKRKNYVRPWDVGKEGVKEHYEYSQEEWVDKKRKERPREFAPPSYHIPDRDDNKSLRFTTKKNKDDGKREKKSVNPYKHKNYEPPVQPTPILNELSDSDEKDSLLADYQLIQNRSGVEIAPPPTYDYYGPGIKKQKTSKQPFNVGDSIEAGLKFLREQAEKKASSSHHSEDMFLS